MLLPADTALWVTTHPAATFRLYYYFGSLYLSMPFQNITVDIQPEDTVSPTGYTVWTTTGATS